MRAALALPREDIWRAHQQAKKSLLEEVKLQAGMDMEPDVMTIGFARRATAYKRGDLLFQDMERLRSISAQVGSFQMILGGKAHPPTSFSRRHDMPRKKGLHIAFIVGFALLTTSLHFLIFRRQSPHVILEELFYIPLLLAAVVFGLKGSLWTYLLISVLYIPFFFGQGSATFLEFTDRLLHLLFTGLFAIIAGILVERNKRRQKQREEDRHLAAIGQVAADIVHDLKNPLIVVLTFAKRIKDKRTNPETGIEPIIESAENMQTIMDSVMDFARPVVLKMKQEDMRDVILRACRSCRPKAEEKGITLSADFPPHPVYLEMDGPHLERAFANLINNSVDASGQGQSIILSLAEGRKIIEARIKDFGTGMDKETMNNLYIPFNSKKKGGTGLGMAIVKKTVEGHQGKIRVCSRPGLGTEFIVTLPYSKADSPVHREKSSEPSCGKPLDREGEKGSDNQALRRRKTYNGLELR